MSRIAWPLLALACSLPSKSDQVRGAASAGDATLDSATSTDRDTGERRPTDDTAPPLDTASTRIAETGETGATTDSGRDTGFGPTVPMVFPAMTLYGELHPDWPPGYWTSSPAQADYLGWSLATLGDNDGDGRDELLLGHLVYLDDYFGYTEAQLVVAFTSGQHRFKDQSIADFWPSSCFGLTALGGDVTGDHLPDLISGGGRVFAGPFTGSKEETCREVYADIEDPVFAAFDGVAVGGFDADHDGFGDLAIADTEGFVHVYYGPLPSGLVPGPADPDLGELTDASWLMQFNEAGEWLTLDGDPFGYNGSSLALIPDFPVPGATSIRSGLWDSYSASSIEQFLVTVDGPRRSRWWLEDISVGLDFNTLYGGARPALPVGDWDADGHQDLAHNRVIYFGPFPGSGARITDQPNSSSWSAYFSNTLPDLNGDGARELLLSGVLYGGANQVLFSDPASIGRRALRDDETMPFAVALALMPPYAADGQPLYFASGDYDGDGLADVAGSNPYAMEGRGAVYVWTGADLLAARR